MRAQLVVGPGPDRAGRRRSRSRSSPRPGSPPGWAPPQIAAHQIGLQLWEFTALLLDSFAIAAQSLVGAALGGSRRRGRAPHGLAGGALGALRRDRLRRASTRAGWSLIPRAFTSSPPVLHQAHVLWPWFVGMLPGGRGGVRPRRRADRRRRRRRSCARSRSSPRVFAFAPLNLAALHWHWGIGGVWAGLTAFIVVRLVGMVLRAARGDRWVVLGTPEAVRSTIDGLVVVDKPAGWTSHDVVGADAAARRTRRVGHAGTLDPMATGVLVLGVGPGDPAAAPPRAHRQGLHGDDPARPGDGHRRRRGRARRPRPAPPGWPMADDPGRDAPLTGDDRAGAQRGVGDQGRRPARLRAGARRRAGRAGRPAGDGGAVRARPTCVRSGELLDVDVARRVLVGHLRPRAGPRPRRRARRRRPPHRAAPHPGRAVHPRRRPHARRSWPRSTTR